MVVKDKQEGKSASLCSAPFRCSSEERGRLDAGSATRRSPTYRQNTPHAISLRLEVLGAHDSAVSRTGYPLCCFDHCHIITERRISLPCRISQAQKADSNLARSLVIMPVGSSSLQKQ